MQQSFLLAIFFLLSVSFSVSLIVDIDGKLWTATTIMSVYCFLLYLLFFSLVLLFIFRISCIKWTKFDLFGVFQLCRWAVQISERTVTYKIHVARTLDSSASLFQGSIYIAFHFGIYTVSKSCWMKYHYSLVPLWLFA